MKKTNGKIDVQRLKSDNPFLRKISLMEEVFWANPNLESSQKAIGKTALNHVDINDAEDRLKRFAPYFEIAFPETKKMHGIIESPLIRIPSMKQHLEEVYEQKLPGELLIKCDSHLPISGSIKARGGIYEVLKHAEDICFQHQMLTIHSDYSMLNDVKFRDLFSQYSIAVGSTGNLGLSIGIIGAKLGFNVTVHMSADAKKWKKDLLHSIGVKVIEYAEDYSKAVEEGRKQAQLNSKCYFIDDENSQDLFLGYSVAAARLKKQLEDMNLAVGKDNPLFVYLPCGVGGAPGGIAFGLKQLFQDNVHCFFAEPTHSPCMLLGLSTGLHDKISVQDFGIDNKTDADGLAVGRPSGFVGRTIEPFLSGCYTIEDEQLYRLLSALRYTENLSLEPSALAGMLGPIKLFKEGFNYLNGSNLINNMGNATHIIWATGGSMVPHDEMEKYYQKGSVIS